MAAVNVAVTVTVAESVAENDKVVNFRKFLFRFSRQISLAIENEFFSDRLLELHHHSCKRQLALGSRFFPVSKLYSVLKTYFVHHEH